MTELLYFNDSYLKEFSAEIIEIIGNGIVLDKTAFYPTGGGQPFDTGTIVKDNQVFQVVSVVKKEGKIIHELSQNSLTKGNKIIGRLDWERRYKLMRMHCSAHLLSSIFHKKAGALITGNQLDIEKSRIDFNLETFDKEEIAKYVDEANALIAQNALIKVYFLPREEAMKNPELVKLAGALPPNIATLRIVEISGIDVQADGGTHVNELKEIGKIELLSLENKGKTNRRLYFSVV